MNSDISKEELDTFLKDDACSDIEKGEPLDKLLEEIMESAQTVDLQKDQVKKPKKFLSWIEKEKSKPLKSPLFPLFLSIGFLGGLLLGITFGYAWKKSQEGNLHKNFFEKIEAEMRQLSREIQDIQEKLGSFSKHEMIEPILPSSEFSDIDPKALR